MSMVQRNKAIRIGYLAIPAGLAAACAVPQGGTDATPPASTYVSGTLRIDDGSGSTAPGGSAVLFRYACDDPPPPQGSGLPDDFLVVPEEEFHEGEARWTFPTVPGGLCILLTGFVDRDRDFHYALGVTAQPTAGDLGISAVPVQTAAAEPGSQWIEPSTGVLLRAELPVPLERPVFVYADLTTGEAGGAMTLGPVPGTTANSYLELSATPLETELVEAGQPYFTVILEADGDGDGWPDDNNGDGAPDVRYPRVLLFRLDPEDPSGLTRAEPTTLLPGVVLPLHIEDPFDLSSNLVLQAMATGLPFDGATPMLATSLRVVVPPLIVTDIASAATAPAEPFHATVSPVDGDYQVLVMNSSGQVWNLPNELGALGLLESQATRFVVAEAEAPPPVGLVQGSLAIADGGDGSPGGDAYVLRFDCLDPPPPEGAGSPLDMAVIKEADFSNGIGLFAFGTVPAGACVLLAGIVDRDHDFDPFYGVTAGATGGDLAVNPAVLLVPEADPSGLVLPVSVELQATTTVPLERPAFVVENAVRGQPPALSLAADETGGLENAVFDIVSTEIDSTFADVSGAFFGVVWAPDGNGDFLPDDNNGDGLPDALWPRILLRRLDDSDPDGLTALEDPPVILPGVLLTVNPANPLDPATSLLGAALAAGVPFDGASIQPVTRATVLVPPLVLTSLDPIQTLDILSAQALGMPVVGRYQVLVMNSTGQLWTLPNELVFEGVEGQEGWFEVEAAGDGSGG
jgi:hypothetical protein